MNSPARIVSLVLGAWLFVSAFLWHHSPEQFTNTWIVGLVSVILTLIAMSVPAVRYLNSALMVWLFISAWALPSESGATIWNNTVVAIVLFIVSLLGAAPAQLEPASTPGEAGGTVR
jgi:hypothetical protein